MSEDIVSAFAPLVGFWLVPLVPLLVTTIMDVVSPPRRSSTSGENG